MRTSVIENSYLRVLISKIPEKTAPNKSHFRTETITITAPELKENELFVKTLVISFESCMLCSNSLLESWTSKIKTLMTELEFYFLFF